MFLEPGPPTLLEILLAAGQGHLASLRPLDGPGWTDGANWPCSRSHRARSQCLSDTAEPCVVASMVHPGCSSTKAHPRVLVVLGGRGRRLVLATNAEWGRGPHVLIREAHV
jgi:hypothetical protein